MTPGHRINCSHGVPEEQSMVTLCLSFRGMTRWGEFDDLHHISGDALKSTEEQPDLEQS